MVAFSDMDLWAEEFQTIYVVTVVLLNRLIETEGRTRFAVSRRQLETSVALPIYL